MVKTGFRIRFLFVCFLIWRLPTFWEPEGFLPLCELVTHQAFWTTISLGLLFTPLLGPGPSWILWGDTKVQLREQEIYWGEIPMQGKRRAGLDRRAIRLCCRPDSTSPIRSASANSVPLGGPMIVEMAQSFCYRLAQLLTKGHPKKNVTLAQSWSITQRSYHLEAVS